MTRPAITDATPDQLVALWRRWESLQKTRPLDGCYDDLSDQMAAIELEIVAATPTTLTGARMQLAIIA